MFNLFTDHARQAMRFAYEEARSRGNDWIGPEDMLRGILRQLCMATAILQNLGIDQGQLRMKCDQGVARGDAKGRDGQIPFTQDARAVLEHTVQEASDLGHNYVGTEHLLLGLIAARSTNAAHVLGEVGVTAKAVREVLTELRGGPGK